MIPRRSSVSSRPWRCRLGSSLATLRRRSRPGRPCVHRMSCRWRRCGRLWRRRCALALAGRFGEVHRIADAGLRAAALSESGPQRFAIGMAEVMASTAAGDFPAAERVWERYAATAAGVPAADAMVDAMRGLVQLARGALPSACAAFHDSISALSHGFPSPWLMLVAAWRAQAEGARGDGEAAAAALRQFGARLRAAGRGVLAGTRAGPGLGAGLRRPDDGRPDACGACRADRAAIRDVRRRDACAAHRRSVR